MISGSALTKTKLLSDADAAASVKQLSNNLLSASPAIFPIHLQSETLASQSSHDPQCSTSQSSTFDPTPPTDKRRKGMSDKENLLVVDVGPQVSFHAHRLTEKSPFGLRSRSITRRASHNTLRTHSIPLPTPSIFLPTYQVTRPGICVLSTSPSPNARSHPSPAYTLTVPQPRSAEEEPPSISSHSHSSRPSLRRITSFQSLAPSAPAPRVLRRVKSSASIAPVQSYSPHADYTPFPIVSVPPSPVITFESANSSEPPRAKHERKAESWSTFGRRLTRYISATNLAEKWLGGSDPDPKGAAVLKLKRVLQNDEFRAWNSPDIHIVEEYLSPEAEQQAQPRSSTSLPSSPLSEYSNSASQSLVQPQTPAAVQHSRPRPLRAQRSFIDPTTYGRIKTEVQVPKLEYTPPTPERDQIAPLDSVLSDLERRSRVGLITACSTCQVTGFNYSTCPKCRKYYCSRECRISVAGGGDGVRHACVKGVKKF